MRITPKYLAATAILAVVSVTVFARDTPAQPASGVSPSVNSAADNASPIYGVTIPAGYRQWELIAPSHEAILDELRGILGNPVAMTAYREGSLPFRTARSWPRLPGSMCRRFRTTAPWESSRLSFPGAPRPFRSWSRIPKSTLQAAVGDSAGSSTANQSMRRSTKHASPATRLSRSNTTSSLRVTHNELEVTSTCIGNRSGVLPLWNIVYVLRHAAVAHCA